jgi:cell wall-associated NlpC family hydrolase
METISTHSLLVECKTSWRKTTRRFIPRAKAALCIAILTALTLGGCHSSVRFSSRAYEYSPATSAAIAARSSDKTSPDKSSKKTSGAKLAKTAPLKKSGLENPSHAPLTQRQSHLIASAERWIGTPYRYGGASKVGSDCSGFSMRVYEELGIALGRSAKDQFAQGAPVEREELLAGDLVFFNTDGKGVSHVGIYVGDDAMIHASTKNGVVRQYLSEAYYVRTYVGARRIAELHEAQ